MRESYRIKGDGSGAAGLQTQQPAALEPLTTILSGHATALGPALFYVFEGGSLRVTHVAVDHPLTYAQFSEQHLVHATLARVRSPSRPAQPGRGHDGRGSISFTPGGRDRSGFADRGEIRGVEIGLAADFVQDACEQRLPAGWGSAFNVENAKAFSFAEQIATAVQSPHCDRLMADTLLHALARHVGQVYGRADRRRDDAWLHPAALARIIAQLKAEPAVPISLGDMSRTAGLGISAFLRAFRGTVGTTPAAFARKVRLDHAAELLRSSDYSIGDIATMSGFASASHLVRVFQQYRGHTPGAWRWTGRV
nr:AraC family transcriptional regulator [uncultured Sphingomonas sp.]